MVGPGVLNPHSGGQPHEEHRDRRIGALADRQHGVVARRDLERLGVSRRAIERRLEAGRLRSLYRGVYSVGHRVVPREGHFLAAVLACGPDATLSHRSAAALWGIRPTARARTEVSCPRALRPRDGIQLHRAILAADERATIEAIPVTTPARTLLDLAAVLDRRQLERAVNEAEVQRIFDGIALAALLDRHPHRHGAPALSAVLADSDPGATRTRSELEAAFLDVVRRHGLPSPEINTRVEAPGSSYEVDALWRPQRLIAELDGAATHSTRRQFERDRLRDTKLTLAGWRVVRITWLRLRGNPAEVAADLQALLAPSHAPRVVDHHSGG